VRSENINSNKTLGGWETPLGELTPLSRHGSRPSFKAPPPLSALRASSFGPGVEATDGPKLLLNQNPSEPCYATGESALQTASRSVIAVFRTA